jgi:hypothetical protein
LLCRQSKFPEALAFFLPTSPFVICSLARNGIGVLEGGRAFAHGQRSPDP